MNADQADLKRVAKDPATAPEVLADLANEAKGVRQVVAANPATPRVGAPVRG